MCLSTFRKNPSINSHVELEAWKRTATLIRISSTRNNPQGWGISKKPVCNQVGSHSLARTPPFCFPDPLPFLASHQDLDTQADTGFPMMQQLPYKLYNKLKLRYDSDKSIISSVHGLINCAHEWICADSLTKLQTRAVHLLCSTLKTSGPPLPGNSFSLLWRGEKEGITSSCWLPALVKPWRLFKWELQRRCMMGCLLLEEAHFTLRFKSLSDSEANSITYRLRASQYSQLRCRGPARMGRTQKGFFFFKCWTGRIFRLGREG